MRTPGHVAMAGTAVVGVAFGMARYAYGLTLPQVRQDLDVSELVLGLVASGTFAGYLAALLLTGPLAARHGPRAPTTLGGVCGVVGCLLVATAPSAPVLAAGALLAGSSAGWVWAPYSDIVARAAPAAQRPRLLAIITTGTSGGLILLGGLAVLAGTGAWRPAWAVIALAAAVAAVVNLRSVPRLEPAGSPARAGGARLLTDRALARPLGYAVVYFAVCIVYFTYAADVLQSAGQGVAATPALYLLVGTTGLVGLLTGTMAARVGTARLAAGCLLVVGAALALLGVLHGSLLGVAVSACLFGAGYMTGSAVLAIWTSEVAPRQPGAAFTATLVVGAVSSVTTPAVVGALLPALGLRTILLATAALAVLGGLVLAGVTRGRGAPATGLAPAGTAQDRGRHG